MQPEKEIKFGTASGKTANVDIIAKKMQDRFINSLE